MSFLALDNALDLIRTLAPLCRTLARHDPKLVDQIRRAGTSVANNLAEGSGRRGADRRHLYRIAYGSFREVRAAFDVAVALGLVDAPPASVLTDRLGAILYRLTR